MSNKKARVIGKEDMNGSARLDFKEKKWVSHLVVLLASTSKTLNVNFLKEGKR